MTPRRQAMGSLNNYKWMEGMKMKKFMLILLILLFASASWASPFLVCDPQASAVGLSFEVREGTTVIYSGANQPDGSIRVDIQDIAVGTHTVTARYVNPSAMWEGERFSADSPPLEFTRPGPVGGSITGFKLVK